MTEQQITIDGKTYALNQLSPQARQQLFNVQAADQEIQRLNIQTALARTARQAYARVLQAELSKLAPAEA